MIIEVIVGLRAHVVFQLKVDESDVIDVDVQVERTIRGWSVTDNMVGTASSCWT